MSASHLVRSFSNTSHRVPSHHQPAPPPAAAMSSSHNHASEYRLSQRLVHNYSPLIHHQPSGGAHANSTFEPAQLIANEAQIDPALLAHENPHNCGPTNLASPLPLDQYKLNVDRHPIVVRRKPQEKVHYSQQVCVRYLKPPAPPKSGDIVIQELPAKQVAPAPALVVRQAPPKSATPPPLILR